MFDGVICDDYNLSNMIFEFLYIKDIIKFCLNGMEVYNV